MKFWVDIANIAVGVVAIISLCISVSVFKQSSDDNYLARRAYIGPKFWNTSDNNQQFQIGFSNFGASPGTNLDIKGRLIANGMSMENSILAEHQVLFPGADSIVPFDFSSEDINRVISDQDGCFQIELTYKDYLNKPHTQRISFGIKVVSNKYQLSIVKQEIVR